MTARRSPTVATVEKPEQIAAELRARIISGELAGGTPLGREPDLVARFAVSRPSMREALRILETEGLIDVVRGVRGGVFVRSPDARMTARTAAMLLRARNVALADVFEARYLLEPPATRVIATRSKGRQAAIDQLRSLIAREEDAIDDHEAFGLANHAFHEALLSLSGNQTLSIVAGILDTVLASALIAVTRADKDLTSTATRRRDLRSQQRLVELLRTGDADGAEKHWRAHMQFLARTMARAASTTLVDLLP
ncbi:FCD domain-containing protein [Mycobacterium sp. CVI_P3]|uniref:FCD domain-containing protein n=1 Tax=Mycobacterium pinniadriaticum TaxID=2994102 RepID=A0ABT3SBG3_9MYCO|nr:FCD domain-containing protein [Mycobacterium pinniadriaticum]MCX2930406.1 FCD domain-containing protein [Mycobacterium pinniadriaticum]MCX2936830.1 FCD domain-containing protein [Mycobacterium pinniadriaticum]